MFSHPGGSGARRPRRAGVGPVEGLEARTLLSGTGGGGPALVEAGPIASASFKVVVDWGAGFGGEIRVENLRDVPVENWQLEFDFGRQIDSIWDARIVSRSGTRYVITHAGWNSTLAPRGSIAFGFNGSPGNVGSDAPTNYRLNGSPLGAAPAGPTLSVADASVLEGNAGTRALRFVVTLSSASATPVTVAYRTADGTAFAGSDYLAGQGTITFAPGETTRAVDVAVLGDATPEADETLALILSDPSGAAIGRGRATGTILNDDTFPQPNPQSAPAKPSLSVEDDPSDPTKIIARFNIWWGTNATGWQLLENGRVVHAAALAANSPGPQSATVRLPKGSYGAYTYEAVAANAAGSTRSDPVTRLYGGASRITLAQADSDRQALQVTVPTGATTYDVSMLGSSARQFQAVSSNESVAKVSVPAPGKLRVEALAPGFASIRVVEPLSGEARYLGVRVREADGSLPGLPDYLAIGSVSEDTPGDLAFWRDFGPGHTNNRMDVRYIYLNGGPEFGWRTWGDTDGGRLVSYLRESQKLGIIPYFVWYNIPDGGESYATNLQHIQDPAYMAAYFRDLKFALDTIRAEAPDQPVGFILEPDFLGYLMQLSGKQPDQIAAVVGAAYSSGLLTRGVDPDFPDTVPGLVRAINYAISKQAPNVSFGWQVNLWASPGVTTPIGAKGLMRLTDTMGIDAGRAAIAREAEAIARYYLAAGIKSYGADFVAIDKYGLDAGAEAGAAANPAGSTWFWNLDHWNNYLLFAKTLNRTTGLPNVLWQIPVGRINGSLAPNPYSPTGTFADLPNTSTRYEDSAPTFFFGDQFRASGARFDYFRTNRGGDSKLSVSGQTITWGPHLDEARDAGIIAILFGAGVGDSTDGVGSAPTDGSWWISKVQQYYKKPVKI